MNPRLGTLDSYGKLKVLEGDEASGECLSFLPTHAFHDSWRHCQDNVRELNESIHPVCRLLHVHKIRGQAWLHWAW